MEITYGILIALANLIEPITLEVFWNKISMSKHEIKKYRIISFFGICMLIVFFPMLQQLFQECTIVFYLSSYVIQVVYFIYAAVFFQINKRVIFILLSVRIFLNTVIEFVFTYILIFFWGVESLMQTDGVKFFGILFLNVCNVYTLYILAKLYKRYSKELEDGKIFNLLLISFVADIIIFGCFYCVSYEEGNYVYNIGIAVTFVYEISLLIYSLYYLANIVKKEEQEHLEVIEFTNKQIEMMNVTEDKIYEAQRAIHDYVHHLTVINTMLNSNMIDEVKDYLEKLVPEVKNKRITMPYGNNTVLSVILFEKKAKAKLENVELTYKIGVDDIAMSVVDLNSIITNILDNAIEAAAKVRSKKDRWVKFNIFVTEKDMIIECSNPYIGKLTRKEGGYFKSSKADKALHGNGISIIDEYVTKYNGDLSIHFENGIFVIQAVLDSKIAIELH